MRGTIEMLNENKIKTTHSFNSKAGCLEIDYKSWISKQDIVYNYPIIEPSDAAMFGNGKVGAAVWNKDGLNLQISAVDASPHSCYSSGYLNISTMPDMLSFNNFHQRMNLYDATVTAEFDNELKITMFGDVNDDLLGITIEDIRENIEEVSIKFGIWDVSTLTSSFLHNESDDFDEWKKIRWMNECKYPAFSRGESSFYDFGYALAFHVTGADYKVVDKNAYEYELKIFPTKKYTIWISNPCKINLESGLSDAVDKSFAKVSISSAEQILSEHITFWHNFWQKSFIQFTDSTENGDYIENTWYISIYMLALASRATYPCHFINGIFRWAGDSNIRWCQYYTYFNMRAINNHWLASNHPDMIKPYLNLYFNLMDAHIGATREICGIDGLKMPEGSDNRGGGMYDTPNNFTGRIYTDALEIALLMYQYSNYFNDNEYLKDCCYPYMREGVRFYTNRLKYDGRFYFIDESNCLEQYWDVKNPITDLAIIKTVFPIFIDLSTQFASDADLRNKAKDILDNLSPIETGIEDGDMIYLPCSSPVPEERNIQNPEMEITFPYGFTGIGSPDYDIALNTWMHRKREYTIWSPDAVSAARLGLGNIAYDGINYMCLGHQIRASGYHDDHNGAFESNGLVTCTINEMMLQSHKGLIRVFPAVPTDENFISKFMLMALGGFLISSEYEKREVKYVGIKSLYGKPFKVFNPWDNAPVRVVCCSDDSILLVTTASEIVCGTRNGESYIIERIDNPFSEMIFTIIIAERNISAKQISNYIPRAKERKFKWTDSRKPALSIVRKLGY